MAGGATGTWAYVRHVKQVKAEKRLEAERRQLREARRKRRIKLAREARKVPAEVPASQAPAPPPVKVAHRSKVKKKAAGKVAPAPESEEKPGQEEGGELIFNDPSMPGGGHVIIVQPPARLEPLFQPEKYRNKGPGMSW